MNKKEYDKKWKAENKDKISLQGKRYYKKHKKKINKKHREYVKNGGNLKRYGMTLDEYNKLLKKQNRVCAICGNKETMRLNGKIKKLAVDHCHETKKVRGLLCDKCNRGLGYMRDSVGLLENAILYLIKNQND